MPKYVYKCPDCETAIQEFRKYKERETPLPCSQCGGQMLYQLPHIMDPTVLETADSYRNVKHRKDQDKRIRKRAKDYFVKNEMDDLISKHGEKEARKFGWVDKNGKKNKGGSLS